MDASKQDLIRNILLISAPFYTLYAMEERSTCFALITNVCAESAVSIFQIFLQPLMDTS